MNKKTLDVPLAEPMQSAILMPKWWGFTCWLNAKIKTKKKKRVKEHRRQRKNNGAQILGHYVSQYAADLMETNRLYCGNYGYVSHLAHFFKGK